MSLQLSQYLDISDTIKFITECVDGCTTPEYYITGVFMQAETPNRNNRIYSRDAMEKAVARYNEHFIKTRRSLGELEHPIPDVTRDGGRISLKRISHIVTELEMRGNDVIGKAKIIDTADGKIVKTLMDEGVTLGVSSRGYGLSKREGRYERIKDDFILMAIDIVYDPSAPNAFVSNITESIDTFLENGHISTDEYQHLLESVQSSKQKDQSLIVSDIEKYLIILN
jgi:hypothetical protein